jgi:hypothetical protein
MLSHEGKGWSNLLEAALGEEPRPLSRKEEVLLVATADM